MQKKLQERLIGAILLTVLAVIFIPAMLSESLKKQNTLGFNIPEKPVLRSITPSVQRLHDGEAKNAVLEQPISVPIPEPQAELNSPQMVVTTADDSIGGDGDKDYHDNEVDKQALSIPKQVQDVADVLSAWAIQLGSFSNENNALALKKKLNTAGYPGFVDPLARDGKIIYRVKVGPEVKRSDAEMLRKKIQQEMAIEGILVAHP